MFSLVYVVNKSAPSASRVSRSPRGRDVRERSPSVSERVESGDASSVCVSRPRAGLEPPRDTPTTRQSAARGNLGDLSVVILFLSCVHTLIENCLKIPILLTWHVR